MTFLERRRALPVAIVLLLVIAFLATGVIVFRPSPRAPIVEPPQIPLIVSAGHTGGATAYVGYPTEVSAHAIGTAPIVALELWVGDHRIATRRSASPSPAGVARWQWVPATAGRQTIVARATDAAGRVAQSRPVRVTVIADPPIVTRIRDVTAAAGETAMSIAARAGGIVDDLEAWNPGIDPDAPIAAGDHVIVPFAATPLMKPPLDLSETSELSAATPPPAALLVPAVTATVNGCTIDLAVADSETNEAGFAVYDLGPDAAAFTRMATLPPVGGTGTTSFSTNATAGQHVLSVSVYDGASEAQSALVIADVPDDCDAAGWTGDARLVGGRLLINEDVDRAYFYMSVDDGPYERVPADSSEFIEPIDGVYDASPFVPASVTRHRVSIEAWGWKGGGLLALGTGHLAGVAPQTPPTNGAAAFSSLDLVVQGDSNEFPEVLSREADLLAYDMDGNPEPKLERPFKWQTAGPVDHVIWQVSAFPIPPSLAPEAPGVLLQETLAVNGASEGTFKVDFGPIFSPPSTASNPSLGDTTFQSIVGTGALPGAPTPAPLATKPPTSSSGTNASAYVNPLLLLGLHPSQLYVRIVPMKGLSVEPQVSNDVHLIVKTATPVDPPTGSGGGSGTPTPTPKPYNVIVKIIPPAQPNPAWERCILITGFKDQAAAQGYAAYKNSDGTPNPLLVGDTICFPKPTYDDGSGFDLAESFGDFVEFVADAVDWLANAYSDLKADVIAFVVSALHCDAVPGMDKAKCTTLATMAVDTVMIAFGIPPSIPDVDGLMDAMKGDFASYVIDNVPGLADACATAKAANSAGSSTPTCEELIEKAVDKIASTAKDAQTSAANAYVGGIGLPGAQYVLHPWGEWRPPRFHVVVFRNNAVPLPANSSCDMSIFMFSETTATWIDYKGVKHENVAIFGEPFLREWAPMPETGAAGFAVRDYYLTKDADWREPGNEKLIHLSSGGYLSQTDQTSHSFRLLAAGANVEGWVTGACHNGAKSAATIPTMVQGWPCKPTAAWWWNTKPDSFWLDPLPDMCELLQ